MILFAVGIDFNVVSRVGEIILVKPGTIKGFVAYRTCGFYGFDIDPDVLVLGNAEEVFAISRVVNFFT